MFIRAFEFGLLFNQGVTPKFTTLLLLVGSYDVLRASLCHQLTLHDQVAFSTTFRKPRMAALCLQMTLDDQVAFTKLRDT